MTFCCQCYKNLKQTMNKYDHLIFYAYVIITRFCYDINGCSDAVYKSLQIRYLTVLKKTLLFNYSWNCEYIMMV